VHYDEFVADPMGAVEEIYARLGEPLRADARAAMSTLHADSTSGTRRPAHRYRLEDFGLTGRQVDDRFADLIPAPR
jgi:hypothetical protein